MFDVNNSSFETIGTFEYVLPVEYDPGYGELEIEVEDDGAAITKFRIFEKRKNENATSDMLVVEVYDPTIWYDAVSGALKDHKIKVTRKYLRVGEIPFDNQNETVIILPDNFNTCIKVDVLGNDGNLRMADESSVVKYDFNNTPEEKTSMHEYYIHGKEMHIVSNLQVKEI